jgi:hypothetical protein
LGIPNLLAKAQVAIDLIVDGFAFATHVTIPHLRISSQYKQASTGQHRKGDEEAATEAAYAV